MRKHAQGSSVRESSVLWPFVLVTHLLLARMIILKNTFKDDDRFFHTCIAQQRFLMGQTVVLLFKQQFALADIPASSQGLEEGMLMRLNIGTLRVTNFCAYYLPLNQKNLGTITTQTMHFLSFTNISLLLYAYGVQYFVHVFLVHCSRFIFVIFCITDIQSLATFIGTPVQLLVNGNFQSTNHMAGSR